MPASHYPSLKTSTLVAYALPGLPLAVATLPVYVFIPTLYSQEFGISLGMIGAILLATRFLDAFSDPIIGILSDRTSSRFGRRKPWLICATPLIVLSIYKLFTPPDEVDSVYLGVWSVTLTVAWTAMLLPYSAWAAELTGGYHERTRLTAIREAFVLVGTMFAAGLPALLTKMGYPSLSTHAFGIASFVVLALPVAIVICAKYVPDVKRVKRKALRWRESFQFLAENAPFRRLLLAYLINATANGLPATLFILFVTHRLEMPEIYGLLLFIYFLSGFAAIPLWYALSKWVSKHRAWCIAMIVASGAFMWTPFLVGPGDFAIFLVITIISGLAVGADLVLPPSVQADVVDMDTLKSGEQRTGLFFALWSVATKLALGLSVGIAFPLLALVGFNAEATKTGAENSAFALLSLSMIYAFVPVIFKVTAIALMWNFPLSQQRQIEIQNILYQKEAVNPLA